MVPTGARLRALFRLPRVMTARLDRNQLDACKRIDGDHVEGYAMVAPCGQHRGEIAQPVAATHRQAGPEMTGPPGHPSNEGDRLPPLNAEDRR